MDLLELFESHLQKKLLQIDTFHPFYEEALNYMLKAGGKRFRPLLLLSIVTAKEPLLVPSSLDVALAIEILHTYSLIHDDLPVMDDADLRRGKETLHKRYDEVTAVLVGDGLNTHAFYLIAQSALASDTKVALIKELSLAGGLFGMVHGQILDCYFEKKPLDLEKLKELHLNKTAKLIAASLKMGAIIANLSHDIQERLYEFGLNLGLLFQIQDDLIDALSLPEDAGKTTNNDQEKNSFVKLLGVDRAMESAEDLARRVSDDLKSFDEKIQKSLKPLLENFITRHHRLKG